jgi:hypothetical protein
MKRLRIAGKCFWGVVFALWFGLLIGLWTSTLLFFGGVIVPKITVRTVIDGWGWVALVLALAVVGSRASRRRIARLFDRSAFRGYAWSTLFVMSLIVLFYAVERWRGHRAWQRLEVEMRGEPLELRGLEPLPVAEEQNFAAVPVIAQWWDTTRESAAPSPWQRLAARVGDSGEGAWEIQEPVNLEACLRQYLPSALDAGGPREVSAAEFLAAWEEFAPMLEELRAGALRTHARFELPYDRGMFDTGLGHRVALFEAIGRAFRLSAVAALRAGKPAVALSEVEHLLRISELVEQEPLLERQRLGLLRAAIQPIWEGIRQSQWSEAQLSVLQASLERPNLLVEYRRAVRKECLLLVDMCEKLFPVRSPVPAMDLADDQAGRMLVMGMRWFYPSGWLLQNQVGLYHLSRDLRERTTDPDEHRMFVDVTRQIKRTWVYQPPSLDPFFATFVMPRAGAIGEDAGQRYAYSQCAMDLAATACAIERYRLARRQLPESLELLVPGWMASVPTDVMDGRALRYRRLNNGQYALYSVGWNQTDDGGRVAVRTRPPEAWEESRQIRSEGDWVWTATRVK